MGDMYNEELRASSQSRGKDHRKKNRRKLRTRVQGIRAFTIPRSLVPLDRQDPLMIPEMEEAVDHLTLQDCLHYQVRREIHRMMS